ncbi:glycosyltransferase [Halodesulfurarchaeum formicicum]|uniref:Glycosyl transferase group 1 n=1 Tax=Halodesulfurarchaeum formicicum TaxID=1873524 RepID=A0A1J1AC05_9EURY|nr:glycosyltransferase [Halodesulfurarchaeum formicicum]APE95315.1 glycosyl transferase group 1 [Halodesulfurarchaeum formicicum]
MARVAVVHNTLDFQGGADAVCLATCEAILRDHEVALFTIGETDPAVLAARFDADVTGLDVQRPPLNSVIGTAVTALGPRIGPQLAFRSVLVSWYYQSHADEFDLAVSTANEMALPEPSIQYVHDPQYHRNRLDGTTEGRLNPLWSWFGSPDTESLQEATVLANSSYTADRMAEIYGVRPQVVHPPVDAIDSTRPWENREQGIVVVGRIAPDKNVLQGIEIVDRLRERGIDIHLHIAGSAPPTYRSYVKRVETEARNRSFVTVERNLSRDRLESLLGAHRYGLNLKRDEHFGMSVAEYVTAGMIAFAPNHGGQREILDDRSDRLFDSIAGAVDLIERAIETGARPSLPRDRFGRDRFKKEMREHVNATLNQ